MLKRRALLALGFLVSLFFLVLAFNGLKWEAFFDSLVHVHVGFLIPAVAIYFGVIVLAAKREQILLRPRRRIPLNKLRDIQIMGTMGNNIYPFSGGEALRVYLLRKNYDIPIPTTTTNVVIVRLVDGLALVALILIALTFGSAPARRFIDITLLAAPLFLAALVGFISVTIKPELVRRGVGLLCRFLPERLHANFIHSGEQVITSLEVLRDTQILYGVIGTTVLLRMLEGAVYWLALIAFGLSGDYWIGLLTMCIVGLSGVISASPGQIGVNHFAVVLVLTTLGIERDPALAYAIVVHMLIFVPVTLAGVYLLTKEGMTWRHFVSARDTQERAIRDEIEYVAYHKEEINPYIHPDHPDTPPELSVARD